LLTSLKHALKIKNNEGTIMARLSFTTTVAVATLLAGAALSAPALADAGWQKQVVSLVVKSQTYPRAAQMRKEQGTAKVRVQVGASGSIDSVELAQSSGSDILDKEAQKMMEKIGSFPPPTGGATSLVVPITWVLD
jgi:periplasmic protein TonB